MKVDEFICELEQELNKRRNVLLQIGEDFMKFLDDESKKTGLKVDEIQGQ